VDALGGVARVDVTRRRSMLTTKKAPSDVP
jgi:hypothetical protein